MPWKLQDAGKGKAFVVDDTGKKYSEKPLPKWMAKRQMKALYANEPQKKELSLDEMAQNIRDAVWRAVNPVIPSVKPVSPWVREIYDTYVIVEQDDKCFQISYTYDPMTGIVTLGDPVEVEMTWVPTGKAIAKFTRKAALLKDGLPASAYLVVEDPAKVTTWHLPVKDADGKPDHRLMGAAMAALTSPGGHRGQKYEGPGKDAALAKLKKMYDMEKMPMPGEKGFHAFKQADGSYRWILFSSSTFRDRDGEIVTGKALAEDVDRCDESGNYGPLRWWHVGGWEYPDGAESWQTWKAGDGIDLGACDFNMLHGKMLIESGTFRDAVIGEAISQIQDDLEASIMFSHPADEPGKSKEYQNIHRLERSLLPAGMASNLLTKLYVSKGQTTMKISEKLAALSAILKDKPDVAQQILADAEAIQKAAELVGLDSKEVSEMFEVKAEETTPEPVIETPAAPVVDETLVDEIGDMTHAQLASFVAEAVKQSLPQPDPAAAAKQAGQEQLIADAILSIKSIADRLATIEATAKQTKQALDELTDARPVGIKQMQNQRPTESPANVVQTAPTGPTMDPGFLKLVTGGK
jgi:hypothetical protein